MRNDKNVSSSEDYSTYLWVGLFLVGLLILGLSIYWISDNTRLAKSADELYAGRMAHGGELFAEQCIACHGSNGEGGSGPALNDRVLLKSTSDDVFFSVIRSGVPNTQMPAWSVDFGGPLTDEDIRGLVTFIRAWEPTAPEILPEEQVSDPAHGAVLFASTCAVCHGTDGKGGREGIPAINDPDRLTQFEDAWYQDVIANGRPAKGMPTWGTVLSPSQLNDLVALISAWRSGEQVTPSFTDTTLIEQALFSLLQNDVESTRLHIERAHMVSKGAGKKVFENLLAQLEAGDLSGAQVTLKTLQEQWPLGDPALGAIGYSANCAVCHGAQGEGGIGSALQNNTFVQSNSNTELVQFVLVGRPDTSMAGFEGRLTEIEIADIVSLIRLWQK
jgi:mono/diheme cytochrome c family protein